MGKKGRKGMLRRGERERELGRRGRKRLREGVKERSGKGEGKGKERTRREEGKGRIRRERKEVKGNGQREKGNG